MGARDVSAAARADDGRSVAHRRDAHREWALLGRGLAEDLRRSCTRPRRADQARKGEVMKTHSVEQDAIARAAAGREADLADLVEELKIPSVSTLPERHEDCLRNARWLRDRLEKLGFETEIVDVMEKGLPVVGADWNGRPGQRHLTVYGHSDVHTPDPTDEWTSPPVCAEVREGQ